MDRNSSNDSFHVLFQDEYIAIIFKPSGLLSVPYPGSHGKTALEMLENVMRKRGSWNKGHHPFAVHRLDRDTSGILMFALSFQAQQKIMNTWHKMITERLYHAVAENPNTQKAQILPDSGLIDAPLAQNAYHQSYVPKDLKNKAQHLSPARTNYKILERGNEYTLFELALDTGKKNQIRAHLAYLGYPLAGDKNYRAKTDPFHRLALHARTLNFIHPYTGENMHFEISEPSSWQKTVEHSIK
ncbi:MAG: RNA pseudouridine synthase [Treponema sp. CETP13]|nr:MAG: RNA pseudouridine synthase [Treponema sp. CETP13]